MNSTALALKHWKTRWQRAVASAGHEHVWINVPTGSLIVLLPTLRKFSDCQRDLDQSQAALTILDERVCLFNQEILSLAKSVQTNSSHGSDDASTTLVGIRQRLDDAALEVEITHLNTQIAQAREQQAQGQQELMRLELDAEGAADDDSVAELIETRENLLLDIEDRAHDALSLRLGKRSVDAALRAQAKNKGLERLIGIRSNGASLQAGQMAKGTRFQLFLALRIAAYHEYAPPVHHR